jgi:hypothetical protein
LSIAGKDTVNDSEEANSQCGSALGFDTSVASWVSKLRQKQPSRIASMGAINFQALKILAAMAKTGEPVGVAAISKLTKVSRRETLDYAGYLVWQGMLMRHKGELFSLSAGSVPQLLRLDVRVILSKLQPHLRQSLIVEDYKITASVSARREFDSFARRFGSVWPLVFGKWDYLSSRGVVNLHLDLLLRVIEREDPVWRVPEPAEMAKTKEEIETRTEPYDWSFEPVERRRSGETIILEEMLRLIFGDLRKWEEWDLPLRSTKELSKIPEKDRNDPEAYSVFLPCFLTYISAWLEDEDLCDLAKAFLDREAGRSRMLLGKMERLLGSPSLAAKR